MTTRRFDGGRRWRTTGRVIFALMLAAAAGGCSDEGEDDILGGGPIEAVSFANEVQPIFTGSCTFSGCHVDSQPQGPPPAGDMELTEGDAHANIVGAPASNTYPGEIRVVPGDPSASLLYQKLSGTDFGAQMPRPPGSITARQREIIRVWIAEGAKNN